ncbi:MAG: type II toxin-antitoxin system death-on-curing family toxin [Spirochaetes bacterium]|nr:type II toxin-antitoxin system death-on-curing family toxin [Spirochaetota bacterium]
MLPIQYVTVEEVIYLHERLIAEFGGATGVRDMGLLDSALHRPQSGYYETLLDQAAALLQSLALNHAFGDGNKRIALSAPFIFLRMNGVTVRCTAAEGENFLIRQVIAAKISIPIIADWLRAHTNN